MQSCYELLFITYQLLHMVQKEKIAPKIAAKNRRCKRAYIAIYRSLGFYAKVRHYAGLGFIKTINNIYKPKTGSYIYENLAKYCRADNRRCPVDRGKVDVDSVSIRREKDATH